MRGQLFAGRYRTLQERAITPASRPTATISLIAPSLARPGTAGPTGSQSQRGNRAISQLDWLVFYKCANHVAFIWLVNTEHGDQARYTNARGEKNMADGRGFIYGWDLLVGGGGGAGAALCRVSRPAERRRSAPAPSPSPPLCRPGRAR